MSQIKDHILKLMYRRTVRRVTAYSLALFVIGLAVGYATEPLYPNLIAALVILLLYIQLFLFKQRLANGTYPTSDHEHGDLRRFIEKNGGTIVPGITLD